MNPANLQQAVQSMLQALQSGKPVMARRQAEAILAKAPGEPNASQVLAMALLQERKAAEALPHVQAALQAAPQHPQALNLQGIALKQLSRLDEARKSFERACAADATFVDARLNLAQLDLADGRVDEAQAGFDFVLKARPQNPSALTGRARTALAQHDNETARAFAEKVLKGQPAHVMARLALADAQLRLGEYENARDMAAEVATAQGLSPTNIAYGLGLAGEASDRLGEFDEAFEFFNRANGALAELHQGVMSGDMSVFHPDTIRTLKAGVDAGLDVVPECPDGEPMPAFLVGFPRSGTTLLEQVLLAHPNISSLGEQDTLAEACAELVLGAGAQGRIAVLTDIDAGECRRRYWQALKARGMTPAHGDLYLDKLPLNSVLLPVIAKIFPRAKIIFALRDPRDVVLSCFQQRFGMNQAMYQMLTLDTAAAYYDEVMGLASAACLKIPNDVLNVRYEDVVADLEREARATIGFLGLGWDDAVLEYRKSARARVIDTPSVAQVVEPIYTRALGKWHNYETYLEPIQGRLAPWVKHWGYGDEPNDTAAS